MLKYYLLGEISGYQGNEYQEGRLLGSAQCSLGNRPDDGDSKHL
jgi:hypothetical protein